MLFKEILGPETIRNFNLDFRLLVDYSECGNCNFKSMKELLKMWQNSVRSLTALHAKIYIADDHCLLTSANLTRTAFERRFEIGTLLNSAEKKLAMKIFEGFWNRGEQVHFEDLKPSTRTGVDMQEREDKERYPKRFRLPDMIESPYWLKILGFSNKTERS